jgi:hypothetical protein
MRHSPTCLAIHRPRRFVEALKQISRPLPANENKPKEGGGPIYRSVSAVFCVTIRARMEEPRPRSAGLLRFHMGNQ